MKRAVVLAFVLAGCGGDNPTLTLSDFTCTPAQLVANQATAVSCDYQFTDADLVADMIHIELVHPDDQVDMQDVAWENDEMLTDGPGYLTVNVTPNSVGDVTLTLELLGGGAASNVESFDFISVSP